MKYEKIVLNEKRNVVLTAIIQEVGGEFNPITSRPAILVLPGGGYSMCSDREAEPVAFAYAKAGFQSFVLRYSVGKHFDWPRPLTDYEQAIELIKSKSEQWHVAIDKIAVVGFSAGGHLAACAATISKHRPNAAILGYAALSNELWKKDYPGMANPINEVDDMTSPCFMFVTRDDFLSKDTVNFHNALAKHDISFESHIYAYGPHGYSTGEDSLRMGSWNLCSRASNWVSDSIEWLGDMLGKFGPEGFLEPACAPRINGNKDKFLSTECTIGHLKIQGPEALKALEPVLKRLEKALSDRSDNVKTDSLILKNLKLRAILEMLSVPEREISKLDDTLKLIPNKK